MLFKIVALKNFSLFTGKHLHCTKSEEILNGKIHFFRSAVRDCNAGLFSVNTAKFLRTAFFK